jgi:hypothetical protein
VNEGFVSECHCTMHMVSKCETAGPGEEGREGRRNALNPSYLTSPASLPIAKFRIRRIQSSGMSSRPVGGCMGAEGPRREGFCRGAFSVRLEGPSAQQVWTLV